MAKKSSSAPYNKGDVLTVKIEDIGNDGEGIGKIDGYTLFIKDAVIGDTVKASVMKSKKNYAYAHLDQVIEASPYRVDPKCPVSRACGGCQIQNMSYTKQLEFKRNKVRNNIVRLGGFEADFIDSIMEPAIGMDGDTCYRYRNKAQFPIGTDKNGELIAGFYAGRTHAIIPVEDCLLGTIENRAILNAVLSHMEKYGIKAYDEVSGKGLVRHVLIRKGFTSGELMVCLVLNCSKAKEYIPKQNELVDVLNKIKGMKSISVNINTKKTNVILSDEVHTIWGQDAITDTLCGIEFSISPLSFYQVNPVQVEKLYNIAVTYAGLTGKETVWDLYCGIGTISLSMAKKAKHVYGVEVIPQAIDNARDNAKKNNITNATFYVGKAEEVLPDFYSGKLVDKNVDKNLLAEENVDNTPASEEKPGDSRKAALHPEVIVVDPPRKGCDKDCLDTMLKMSPDRIVYVSCDSATLARDLRILADGGYTLQKVRPVDMFPHTVHVETVCLLSKLHEAKHHINVKVDMDELDLTSAEAKATYKEIEEWVQENYGFHVTNLNIAQVKQKYGIIERENYNKAKSVDSKQPGCPEEKVKAIEDAMRHFQMI